MTAPLDGLLVIHRPQPGAGRPARHADARRPRRSGDQGRGSGGRGRHPGSGTAIPARHARHSREPAGFHRQDKPSGAVRSGSTTPSWN
jgi:hypothetical protein